MSEFERENRYIVIKRKDLEKVPAAYRSSLVDPMFNLIPHLPKRECVVVEKDWPEYNFVWLMLEHRMAGYPVPDFNAVKCAADVQAAQSELAALREELAEKASELEELFLTIEALTAGLVTAEQNLCKRDGLLRAALPAVKFESNRGDEVGKQYRELVGKIEAILQPTESGASE